MNFEFLSDANFTILLGIVFTVMVMVISALYDKKKSQESKTPDEDNRKSLKNHPANREKMQTLFENLKVKISSIKLALSSKLTNFSIRKEEETGENTSDSPKSNGSKSGNGFDVDELLKDKKDELEFGDDLLSEMATADSITPDVTDVTATESDPNFSENADMPLNNDFEIDTDDFDFGFETADDISPDGGDLGLEGNDYEIAFADENDSFMESLKKEVKVVKEEKINFMSGLEDENLDINKIKAELEDVLARLKKVQCYQQ
jgi:hypothetical protein